MSRIFIARKREKERLEKLKDSLAYKLVLEMKLDYDNDLLDWSSCFYEGDSPEIDQLALAEKLQKVLDANNISSK